MKQNTCTNFNKCTSQTKISDAYISGELPREVWCFPFLASPDIQSSVCGSCVPQVFHFLQRAERSDYEEPQFPAEKENTLAHEKGNIKSRCSALYYMFGNCVKFH